MSDQLTHAEGRTCEVLETARSKARPAIQILNSGKVMPTTLPGSEAVRVGDLLFLSGQVGIPPGSTKIIEGGIREQTKQIMENIKSCLELNGSGMNNIVRCTVYLTDMSHWRSYTQVYTSYFELGKYPARCTVAVNGFAMGNALIEIECTAAVGQ